MTGSKMIDDGGPVFPTIHGYVDSFGSLKQKSNGASLRAWFAGLAMANMAEMHNGIGVDPSAVARAACQYADALISELKAGAA